MTEEELDNLLNRLDDLPDAELLAYVAGRCDESDIVDRCVDYPIEHVTDDDILDAAVDILRTCSFDDKSSFIENIGHVPIGEFDVIIDRVTAMLPADRERLCTAIMDASAHDIRLILE